MLNQHTCKPEGATSVTKPFNHNRESSLCRHDRDNDHSMIHHYASIPDVFELTTTPLSHPSKGSPTVIEFARLERGITSALLQRQRAT
jgi:hypothetical protein